MNWFDKLTDAQRSKVLAFSIGYLTVTSKHANSNEQIRLSRSLLKDMEEFADNVDDLIGKTPQTDWKNLYYHAVKENEQLENEIKKLKEEPLYKYNCSKCGNEYISNESTHKYCDTDQCVDKDVLIHGPYYIEVENR